MTAQEFAQMIVSQFSVRSNCSATIVNDRTTEDSVVEHVIDFDVEIGPEQNKEQFNVSVTVIKM